ncbi:MAG: TonB-dependent receptor [Pseudomonadota bacterium]
MFDVIERTAGASLGANAEQIVIRGVPAAGLGGGAPVITTSIDGALIDAGRFSGNALQSTWDLDQIEVLRGPQSTQTGRNALAGAVVIRSADPVHDLEIKARAEVGNGDTLEGAFAVNVPLVEDRLALRVSLDRQQTDGFVKNITLGGADVDDRADTTLSTSLLFEPTEDFSAIFKSTRIETDSSANGPPIQGARFPDSRIAIASFPEREIGTFNAGNLRLGYDVTDAFRLESETTISQSDTLTNTDFDFTEEPLAIFINDQNVRAIEQEIKLIYEGDGVSAVLGGFFAHQETEFVSDSIFPANLLITTAPPNVTLVALQEINATRTNFAAFGEAEIELLPRLSLLAGLRYDRQINEDAQNTLVTPPLLPSSSGGGKATFDAFLPKVGLAFDITEDITLGATAQRA